MLINTTLMSIHVINVVDKWCIQCSLIIIRVYYCVITANLWGSDRPVSIPILMLCGFKFTCTYPYNMWRYSWEELTLNVCTWPGCVTRGGDFLWWTGRISAHFRETSLGNVFDCLASDSRQTYADLLQSCKYKVVLQFVFGKLVKLDF